MPHYGDGRAATESIREATENSLAKADELGCESLVVPILGTGAVGFDFETGTQIVCEAIWKYEPGTLDDARVIAYSTPEYETVREIATWLHSNSE